MKILPMLLKPPTKCIYCGSAEGRRSDEHIIPFSLGGTWVLPNASCDECAKITSAVERKVSREAYLPLRTKADFPTYRKKKRPKHFEVTLIKESGEQQIISVPVKKYPTIYPVLHLAPPRILNNEEPIAGNPEMRLDLGGNPKELEALFKHYPEAVAFEFHTEISWSHFCIALAKIAHSFVVGYLGDLGYTQLLPSLILGNDQFFSHLVGGAVAISDSRVTGSTKGLSIAVQNDFIVVGIDLMGGRLPTYSVVAGKVDDWQKFNTNAAHASHDQKPEYSKEIRTRFAFNADYVFAIVEYIRWMVETECKEYMHVWPLLNGVLFDAYALPPKHIILVLKNSPDARVAGPDGALVLDIQDCPPLPPRVSDLPVWRDWFVQKLGISADEWPIIIPTHDSGKSNTHEDYLLFSDEDKEFWQGQLNFLLDQQYVHVDSLNT